MAAAWRGGGRHGRGRLADAVRPPVPRVPRGLLHRLGWRPCPPAPARALRRRALAACVLFPLSGLFSAPAQAQTSNVTVSVEAVHAKAAVRIAVPEFRVTRSAASTSALTVTLTIAQSQSYYSNAASFTRRVTIAANATSAVLKLTRGGNVFRAAGTLTATVTPRAGYVAIAPPANAASVQMFRTADYRAGWAATAYSVDEGESVDLKLEFRTPAGGPKPRQQAQVAVLTRYGTATQTVDYTRVSTRIAMPTAPSDWLPTTDGAAFVATVTVPVQTHDDANEAGNPHYEEDETFLVSVLRAPGSAISNFNPAQTTVTIIDSLPSTPGAPAAPTVSAGQRSLTLSWAPPAHLGSASAITDYDLRYWQGTGDPPFEQLWIEEGESYGPPNPGTATSAKITGLTPDTPYRVQVRAAGDGESPWSASLAARTAPRPPSVCRAPDFSFDGGRARVWEGRMTVGRSGASLGFNASAGYGTLSNNGFSLLQFSGVRVKSLELARIAQRVRLRLEFADSAMTLSELTGVRLHICDRSFDIGPSSGSGLTHQGSSYTWTEHGLDWAEGTSRRVALSVPTGDVVFSPAAFGVREGYESSYQVSLAVRPSAGTKVLVMPLSRNTRAVTVSPARLEFSSANWSTPQTVTVRGVRDANRASEQVGIRHLVVREGYIVHGLKDVQVTTIENDTHGVTLVPSSLSLEEGTRQSYRFRLNQRPTGDVTVLITSSDTDAATSWPNSVTLNSSNWEDGVEVIVTSRSDDDANDESVTISHTLSGGGYDGVTVPDLTAKVKDDDEPG